MPKKSNISQIIKLIIAWIICFCIRLIPFRPPNFEPLLATQMPFSKKMGGLYGYSFAFFSVFLFDIISQKFGIWTVITAFTYGIVGFLATYYFKKYKRSRFLYLKYAIIGTLIYDAITGLTIGPLLFGQSFRESFYGQIPFTINHLVGNVLLAVLFSPVIEKWIVTNPSLDFSKLWFKINQAKLFLTTE